MKGEDYMKQFLKDMANDAILNGMSTMYIFFVSLISYDNNRTKGQIKQNCEILKELIEVLSDYPNNKELQIIKQQAIQYNEQYSIN